jgi:hypothetical protein
MTRVSGITSTQKAVLGGELHEVALFTVFQLVDAIKSFALSNSNDERYIFELPERITLYNCTRNSKAHKITHLCEVA